MGNGFTWGEKEERAELFGSAEEVEKGIEDISFFDSKHGASLLIHSSWQALALLRGCELFRAVPMKCLSSQVLWEGGCTIKARDRQKLRC